jgi:alkanesulfonate monooxygenase SsuD/methylene tetrahydromethanopterin reductase-like flavin-dependent oxidoreductase (luciferase family)
MDHARIALSLMPLETRRDVLVGLARDADRLGYDGYFLPETWAYDTTIVLAEAATRTERITLGTGILGVWNRSAATMAMAAATLASLSGGRFVLGLGASTAQLTEGLHDVPFRAPAARLRRVVTQVRALLRGDRVPLADVAAARALKLNLPLAPDVPIYLAALADTSIRLAGELADGWVPFLYPLRQIPAGLALLREGAARRGDGARLPALCPSVPAVVAETAAEARAGAAWFASFYLTTMGTLYRQSLVRQGFAREVDAVLAANAPKFAGVVPPEADALLEELIVFGTPAEARRRLGRWHEAGAEMPILLLRPGMSAEEIELTLGAFRPMLESRSG